jgi:hypothetical protein
MKKRNLGIIIMITLISLSVLGLQKINNDYYILWNANSFEVTATKPLSVDKVKIEFGVSVNTINRNDDLDLFKNRSKYTLLFDGVDKHKMNNEYGENDFLITYDSKYYFSFRHFKLSNHHQHKYIFNFYEQDSTIFIKAKFIGQDIMSFERPMNLISDANKLRCNGEIDSNKIIYNMLEMTYPNSQKSQKY